jgi:hypothetical protein
MQDLNLLTADKLIAATAQGSPNSVAHLQKTCRHITYVTAALRTRLVGRGIAQEEQQQGQGLYQTEHGKTVVTTSRTCLSIPLR